VVATDGKGGNYGPVALYVGGSGEVRFKSLAIKDLNKRITPTEKVSTRFRAQHVEDFDYGWSMAAGDFNHDGVLDVTMGNRYYLGPKFEESREFLPRSALQPGEGVRAGDGQLRRRLHRRWLDDILAVESRPPVLYVNPRAKAAAGRVMRSHPLSPRRRSRSRTSMATAFRPNFFGRQRRPVDHAGQSQPHRAVEGLRRLATWPGGGEHPRHRRRRRE